MKKISTFSEVLDAADKLSVEEQEEIIDILRRRTIERRRKELAREVAAAQKEFKAGKAKPATPDEIVKEILS